VRVPAPIVPGAMALAFALAGPVLLKDPSTIALPTSPAMALKDLEALELRLQGKWAGPDCGGEFIFRADGSYERLHVGPGGVNSAGTWRLRWDALRPSLVLSCRTSDESRDVGQTLEVRIVQVGDAALVFNHPLSGRCRYSRVWR
jgi:hypothetical protein